MTDDSLAVVDGEALCKADRSRVYTLAARYLLFPPSVCACVSAWLRSCAVQSCVCVIFIHIAMSGHLLYVITCEVKFLLSTYFFFSHLLLGPLRV